VIDDGEDDEQDQADAVDATWRRTGSWYSWKNNSLPGKARQNAEHNEGDQRGSDRHRPAIERARL
jgi:hypothetical protein